MANANENEEAPKTNLSLEKDVAQSGNIEEKEEEGEYEYEEEESEDEYEVEGEDEDEDEEEEEGEEKVNDGEKAIVVVNDEGLNTNKGEEEAKKENAGKEDSIRREDEKKTKENGENSKSKGKESRSVNKNKKKDAQKASGTLASNGGKPESSSKKKASKRSESMGMVFMCNSKTKIDCFRYKILGLPDNKKDQVAKIYRGMRLFLFDIDTRLMYGIFKAAGPGGYNIEPKAFKSEFPSQVRFTVLKDYSPLAEENFKDVIKENYYARNKFGGLLKAEQVKSLCKLFMKMDRGGGHPKPTVKPRRIRPIENHQIRPNKIPRNKVDDPHSSTPRENRKTRPRDEEKRPREKRKIRPREEEKRPRSPPRSPPRRQKKRYTEYEYERERPRVLYEQERERPHVLYEQERVRPRVLYEQERERPRVLYEREPPVPRYQPPPSLLPPPAAASPARLYTYERQPLDVPPPYVREAPPLYREPVYTLPPPEYNLVSREYNPLPIQTPEYNLVRREYNPPIQTPEYRLPESSRVVPSYRDVGPMTDYRFTAPSPPDYRSRTHYRY